MRAAKLIFAENVRQALEYVGRGEVDAGFVYTHRRALRGQAVKKPSGRRGTYRRSPTRRRRGGGAAARARPGVRRAAAGSRRQAVLGRFGSSPHRPACD